MTNPGVHGNLLIKYENMILLHEEPVCVCPRCRRTSGTTLPGTRYPACSPRSGATRHDAGNVLSTLVRHPKLTRAYLKFSTYLLYGSTLPPRIREQVILRVAHRRGCAYEWSHHVEIGKEVGTLRRRHRGRADGPVEQTRSTAR